MNREEPIDMPELDLNPLNREDLPEVERRLLACCLRGDDSDPGVDDAAELVSSADFAIPAHGLVYDAALACRRENTFVLLADVFIRLRQWQAADPNLPPLFRSLGSSLPAWLANTLELEPTGMHARIYAGHVREASLFRQLRGVSAEISRYAAMPTGPAAEVLAQCEKLLFDLTDSSAVAKHVLHDSASIMRRAAERVDSRQASGGALSGLGTGYADLDELLGGMRPGQMIVVGGRPGGGKTALGLNLATNVANSGSPVVFFSMEMGEEEIGDRLLAMGSGVAMSKFTKGRRLDPREVDRLAEASGPKWVGGAAFYLDDTPDAPAQRIAAMLRHSVRRHGVGLAVIDYLQLMRPENPRENRVQQVGLSSRRVKQMARECRVPVVCLCQLNRAVDQNANDRPKLSNLRESGEIEQHADIVLLLHTPSGQSNDSPVWTTDVIVAKNRNGPVGEFQLCYRRATTRFENYMGDSGGVR